MKTKSPSQTCGDLSGKGFGHLGHFRKKEFIDAGHNTDVRSFLGMAPKKSLYEQEMEKARTREAAPAPVAPAVRAPAADETNRRRQLDDEIKKAGG